MKKKNATPLQFIDAALHFIRYNVNKLILDQLNFGSTGPNGQLQKFGTNLELDQRVLVKSMVMSK